MRINIYAEEITDRIEVVRKTVDGVEFVGVRFYIYTPVFTSRNSETPPYHHNVRGPFIHREGDDDSSAVTFWGKPGVDVRDLMAAAAVAVRHHLQERGAGGSDPHAQGRSEEERL